MTRGHLQHRPGTEAYHDVDSGQVLQRPAYYLLPKKLTPTDPFDEVALGPATLTSGILRHKLWFSRTFAQITRWQVDASAAGGGTSEIMTRAVNGAGIDGGEFIIEDHYQAAADRFLHNPTFSGGNFQQSYGLTVPTSIQRTLHPPIIEHLVHRVQGREILCEGSVIPLEFGPDGFEQGGAQDHGGGRDTAVGYLGMKMFLRCSLVDDVMHQVFWRYSPVSWDAVSGKGLRDVLFTGGFSTAFWPIFREYAEFYDPIAQVSFDRSAIWSASAITQLIRGRISGMELYGDNNSGAGPWSIVFGGQSLRLASEMVGAIMATDAHFAGGQLAVGMLARLRPLEDNRGASPTFIDLQEVQQTLTPGTDNAIYQLLGLNAGTNDGRPRGWVGGEAWLICKRTRAEVRAAMRQIALAGTPVREVPFGLVPPHVKAGTYLGHT